MLREKGAGNQKCEAPEEPFRLLVPDPNGTVNNPVAIVDHESGAIHFLYCLEYMRCFYIRSDDDGLSWTEPVEITETFQQFRGECDWKVIATGPSHAMQLTRGQHKGRLVDSYGKKLNWGQPFQSQGGPATGGAYSIEPHVAENLFDEMASEAGVIVRREARLKSVNKEGLASRHC